MIRRIGAMAAATFLLAGCNGALNDVFRIGPPTPAPIMGTPRPSPSPSSSPGSANASGYVEDYDKAIPIANVPIAIAPLSSSTTPTKVATTDATGKFSFSAPPATYLIIVGNDSPTGPQTTYHGSRQLVAGSNLLGDPPPSNTSPSIVNKSQTDGNFRIATVTPDELTCLTAVNAGRKTLGLLPLSPDESAYELVRYYGNLQNVFDVENPTTDATVTNFGLLGAQAATTHTGDTDCNTYAGSYSFAPANTPYASVTNPKTTWYAAEFTSSGTHTYGVQVELARP